MWLQSIAWNFSLWRNQELFCSTVLKVLNLHFSEIFQIICATLNFVSFPFFLIINIFFLINISFLINVSFSINMSFPINIFLINISSFSFYSTVQNRLSYYPRCKYYNFGACSCSSAEFYISLDIWSA